MRRLVILTHCDTTRCWGKGGRDGEEGGVGAPVFGPQFPREED